MDRVQAEVSRHVDGGSSRTSSTMWIGVDEMPPSAGHQFYQKLSEMLGEADF